jgi:glycosyltransferase involved in cell wall biosynthesis
MPPVISIIIPAFNEGDLIHKSLSETYRVLANTRFEIIVVDDGSTDNTRNQAVRFQEHDNRVRVVSLEGNCGKGAALMYGSRIARGDIIAFLDADLDLHPVLILRFWRLMFDSRADVVIGSKRHPKSNLQYPFFRRMISNGYAVFNRFLFGLDLYDTQTGIKLFRAEVINRVIDRLKSKRYAFDLELLVTISRFGYRIIEAPVDLKFNRPHGGRLRFKAVCGTLFDTLCIYYQTSFWRWLEPSVRMRMWIIIFVLGLVIGSFGLAHWLAVYIQIPQNIAHLAYLLTLRFLNTEIRDGLMVAVGILVTIAAGIQLNKGILAAFARADRGYTIDQKSATEMPRPEIPPPPEG